MSPIQTEFLTTLHTSGPMDRESFDAFGPALEPAAREQMLNALCADGLVYVVFGAWGDAPLQLIRVHLTDAGRAAVEGS